MYQEGSAAVRSTKPGTTLGPRLCGYRVAGKSAWPRCLVVTTLDRLSILGCADVAVRLGSVLVM